MKRLLVLSALFLVAATVPPTVFHNEAPVLEITTSILPVTHDTFHLLGREQPGTYRCSVQAHEPASRRFWKAKALVLGPGSSGETSTAMGELTMTFHASIAKELDRADTTITVMRDGKVVNRQRSTVWLQRQTQSQRFQ